MKKLLVMILAATILSLFVGCAVAEEEIPITSQTSPDGNYKVTLYQVGDPTWSFGSVSAKLVLEDAEGKKLDEEQFELNNDGTGVGSGNIVAITWEATRAAVQMKEFDTTKQYTYYLQYSE